MRDQKNTSTPLVAHLLELRQRLIRSGMVLIAGFVVLYPFADNLFTWLAAPLRAVLPEGASMIAVQVAAPFLIPMKLALLAALFVTTPYLLHQAWSFVAPGLHRHERRIGWPLLACSTFLFYAGAAFAYFVVFPLTFAFFAASAPSGVLPMTDIGEYLDFVLLLLPAFSLAFQMPILTFIIVRSGIIELESLSNKRPYVIVAAFIAGMLLTPPDIISQTLLAVPVWLLYEVGLLAARFSGKTRREDVGRDNEGQAYKAGKSA